MVAPLLPGFVFSFSPKYQEFGLRDMAAVDYKLMLALGYDKYIAQAGDWGSMIVRIMGVAYPEHYVTILVNMIIGTPLSI